MRTPPSPKTAVVLGLTVLLTGACGEEEITNPPPPTGTVTVSTASIGSAIDADGYTILLDGTSIGPIGASGSVSVDVAVGQYDVELTGLADNCGVIGENPISATAVQDEATPVQFSVACPPFYDYIAFYSHRSNWEVRGIFVMRPDGSNLAIIASDSATSLPYPEWSPDAMRIAYSGDDVHVLDIATQSSTQVTENANVGSCSWSPDGERIVYDSFTGESQGDAWGDIYVINVDGGDPVNLTPGPARGFDPAWSPDGTRIAFGSTEGDTANIWVMQADGSDPVRLTDHQPVTTSAADDPAWSPDGSRIAYLGPSEGPAAIWVMDADGSNRVRLTEANQYTHVHGPAWSPDGARIAFWADNEVYVMNADGSNPVNLTNNPFYDAYPAWSPSQ